MKQRISLIKKIDAILGPFLIKSFPGVKFKNKPENIRRILVIRPGGMGDAVLLLPVLKEIKLKYSGIIIDILCEYRNSGIFSSTPYVDNIMLYDNPVSMIPLFRRTYDIIIDTEQSHFLSVIICRLLRGKYKIGFDVYGRGRLFNKSIEYHHNLYEAQTFHKLFQTIFNISETAVIEPTYFKDDESANVVNKIITYGIDKRIICIFPGATVSERLWPEDRWAHIADTMADNSCLVVLLGGNMERKQCYNIKKMCRNDNVFDMSGKLSLLQTSLLFSKSNLLISTDSGILHLGVLSDIPTVSLFGSGIIEKWAPIGDHHIVISKDLECSPCTQFGSTPECLNKNACMISITSADIIEAAQELL